MATPKKTSSALTDCRMVYLSDKPPAEGPEMLADYPDLLTVQHVASITGLSEQTVRKEIAEGRLPGCKIGRRLFVPKHKFIEYTGGGAPYAATQ